MTLGRPPFSGQLINKVCFFQTASRTDDSRGWRRTSHLLTNRSLYPSLRVRASCGGLPSPPLCLFPPKSLRYHRVTIVPRRVRGRASVWQRRRPNLLGSFANISSCLITAARASTDRSGTTTATSVASSFWLLCADHAKPNRRNRICGRSRLGPHKDAGFPCQRPWFYGIDGQNMWLTQLQPPCSHVVAGAGRKGSRKQSPHCGRAQGQASAVLSDVSGELLAQTWLKHDGYRRPAGVDRRYWPAEPSRYL